jgi:DNA-binding Lrp family transcriptional regulator
LLVVTVYILIQTEVGKAAQVAKDIVEIKGVRQAEDMTGPYDATGPYDVIVRVEARNIDELAKLVAARTGGQRDHEDPHLSGGAPLALLDHRSSGRPPTAAATAMRADRGGRRRAAASGASW